MRKKEIKKCEQLRKDCFAFEKNNCKVLSDTHFESDCPFYKNIKRHIADSKKYSEIENEIPFDDYIEKGYGYF